MSQDAVYQFFQDKHAEEPEKFFKPSEVRKAMRDRGGCTKTVNGDLVKLYAYGYLEVNNTDIFNRTYRLKAKAATIKKVISPLSPDITMEEYRRLS